MKPKFRLWDSNKKVFLNSPDFLITTDGQVVHHNLRGELIPRPEFILQQSTGLYDSTGQEVFDGDILGGISEMVYLMSGKKTGETRQVYEQVVWSDNKGWCTQKPNEDHLCPLSISLRFYPVVGNIMQNQELIYEK